MAQSFLIMKDKKNETIAFVRDKGCIFLVVKIKN
jgi:hypothetical protein